ncbi:alpha-glucan family phosphorylase [Mucilaginibacter sp. UYCu711]|jgi:starch phosphorylase|uniref:alpha-glucan family phosphorylase n=1 Tax=Mucilaginibacter sp. UYCu711 TaxID=3156339 RepID=UPI003D1EC3FF
MPINRKTLFSYEPNPQFTLPVAYFCMEFAIDQSLKIYSGGLGFLSGSHLKSAYQLKQNLIGVGLLWKYGYYDQGRNGNALMAAEFIEKKYSFLDDTGLIVTVQVHDAPVHVKVFLLKPETFGSAPLLLLSTDIPDNDDLSQSITHCLYDSNESTRIAQSIVLGIGGAMALDQLGLTPAVYHLNEGHGVALNFYLYAKFKSLAEVQKRVVFTTHTPESAGNEAHNFNLLEEMSFFYRLPQQDVRSLLGLDGPNFNYTLAALKFAKRANGVSKMHGAVARQMWGSEKGVCDIISITNAQNKAYWGDVEIDLTISTNNGQAFYARKKELKRQLFKVVANQCGKLFDENVLTIVWARRFAGYKRADLLMYDWERFIRLVSNSQYPVQLIWAGKPYPEDTAGIDLFNYIITKSKPFANCAVLTGYELELSACLKKGSDTWLNNPRMYHEASGTSGMTAAMNGSLNLSMPDGWVPEFARDGENCFLIPPANQSLAVDEKDRLENINLMDTLENQVLPMYYLDKLKWMRLVKKAAEDVVPLFDADRLAGEYYELMYTV